MKQLLSLFNLRDIEIKLYETLFYSGVISAGQIAKQLNISRPSVYDLLQVLKETGLILESSKGGVKMFSVQPPGKIDLLIKEKQQKIESAKKALEYVRREFSSKQKNSPPRLQLFEGQPALQQMMKDMLLYRDMTVYAYWPIKKIINLLTPSFLEKFHQDRIAQNVSIKVIWPKNQIPSVKLYPFLQMEKQAKREARIAPLHIDFSLGYAIYGNSVRFISSKRENFGFLVESQELAEMMKSQWQVIWSQSKPFKGDT